MPKSWKLKKIFKKNDANSTKISTEDNSKCLEGEQVKI